jgi:ABC-type bacteriocin/lantibiotic exporter with double-glycine peptidase domain
MLTQIDKLKELASSWEKSRKSRVTPCLLNRYTAAEPGIVLKNVHYSRGGASVNIDHVNINPGVYALTGANGSGKSTLFRVLSELQYEHQERRSCQVVSVLRLPVIPLLRWML